MRRVAPVLIAGLLAGCGKDGPTSPPVAVTTTTTIPTVSEVRDGITGAVLGASVQASGSTVTASASGYLTRQQPSASTLYLWPQAEGYVQQLVYTSAGDAVTPIRLQRWAPGSTLRIALASGLERHQDLLAESVAEMVRVTRAPVVLLQPGDVSANVVIAVDTTVPSQYSAVTRTSLVGSTIFSARISFYADRAIANDPWRNLLLHELGHVVGLGHSGDRGDVMATGSSRHNERVWGDAEARALTMMYAWRKAGNAFPDVEAAGVNTARSERVIGCPR